MKNYFIGSDHCPDDEDWHGAPVCLYVPALQIDRRFLFS